MVMSSKGLFKVTAFFVGKCRKIKNVIIKLKRNRRILTAKGNSNDWGRYKLILYHHAVMKNVYLCTNVYAPVKCNIQ